VYPVSSFNSLSAFNSILSSDLSNSPPGISNTYLFTGGLKTAIKIRLLLLKFLNLRIPIIETPLQAGFILLVNLSTYSYYIYN